MLSPRTWKTPTIDVFRVNIYLKKKSYHSICKDCTEAASASSLQLSHPKVPRLAVCPTACPWVPHSFCGSLLPCHCSHPCPPGPCIAAQLMALVMVPHCRCPTALQLAGEADGILEAEPPAWQGAGSGRVGLNGARAGPAGSQHHPQHCPVPLQVACLAQRPALPTSLPLASHPWATGARGPQLCLHRVAFFQQHCSPGLVLDIKGLVLSPPALGCSPLSCSGAAWPARCLRSPSE